MPIIDKRMIQVGEKIIECEVAGMLGISINNVKTICSPLILPGQHSVRINNTQWHLLTGRLVKLPTVSVR